MVGVSDQCIAQHPSDMAVAMRLLDARIETVMPDGAGRAIPIADFHKLPGKTPWIETVLRPGEFITAVTLPKPIDGVHSYTKVRDRAFYALVSLAAIDALSGRRFAFAGIAPKPWRVEAAEPLSGAYAIADRVFAGATPTADTRFKLTLVYRLVASQL